MKPMRTFLRRDLGRLVYKYSCRARFLGINVDFAFGKDYIMGNLTYFKRCPFNYLRILKPNENKIFIPANPACCGFSFNPVLDLIKSELKKENNI